MLATIWARTEISVRDKSVYLGEIDMSQPSTTPASRRSFQEVKESSESIKDKLEHKDK